MTDLTEKERHARALARRDRLFARMAWWDRWRTTLLLPVIATGAGAGALVGLLLREQFRRLPGLTVGICAVLGVVAVGRWVTMFFDPRALEMANRRLHALGRKK